MKGVALLSFQLAEGAGQGGGGHKPIDFVKIGRDVTKSPVRSVVLCCVGVLFCFFRCVLLFFVLRFHSTG